MSVCVIPLNGLEFILSLMPEGGAACGIDHVPLGYEYSQRTG